MPEKITNGPSVDPLPLDVNAASRALVRQIEAEGAKPAHGAPPHHRECAQLNRRQGGRRTHHRRKV